MIPVDQTTYGHTDGNCFSACVASILEIPIEEVPNTLGVNAELMRWLAGRGLSATMFYRGAHEVMAGARKQRAAESSAS